MIDVQTMLSLLVWLLIPVFTFFISLKAKLKLPGRGSTLMVAGSVLMVLSVVANILFKYGLVLQGILDFNIDSMQIFYLISEFVSTVAQVLFLSGLYLLIEAATNSGNSMNSLDQY